MRRRKKSSRIGILWHRWPHQLYINERCNAWLLINFFFNSINVVDTQKSKYSVYGQAVHIRGLKQQIQSTSRKSVISMTMQTFMVVKKIKYDNLIKMKFLKFLCDIFCVGFLWTRWDHLFWTELWLIGKVDHWICF